ncbi:MAG: RDD family protein [Nannocystaceae bacterium]|nr:RDD family protein [bacterium]
MNEPTAALDVPNPTGRLVQPGLWALASGEEVALGGRVGRLLARWVDLSSFYGAWFLLAVALSTERLLISLPVGALLCAFVLGQVLGLALWGRTLGKAVFGLKIVHRSGRPIGTLRGLVVREGLRLLAQLTGVLVLVDLALIFRADRRTLHDLVSGSVVVHQPIDWTALSRITTR